jgi:hypothetical protein
MRRVTRSVYQSAFNLIEEEGYTDTRPFGLERIDKETRVNNPAHQSPVTTTIRV